MTSRPNSFVLFPIGKKRFALPAGSVTELARPDCEQVFPHTSKLLTGVLVRRGHIIPVCDVAPVLVGPNAPPRKFFLIATRKFSDTSEWTAIPVSGECELTTTELLPPTGKLPRHVIGLLALDNEIIEVVDLERLIGTGAAA
jgi:chemotaxis signal transduction protein